MDSARPRTIADLAARLGVSAMTVHRAVSGKPDIAPHTRDRILAEIERISWRPNMAARGLRQGKTFSLGVIFSNVAASFLPEILQGVNRAAEERGCHVFVSVHEHDALRAERHLNTLHSKGVDGIIHYPTHDAGEMSVLNQVHESTPTVVVMRDAPGFLGPSIHVDDRLGGRLAVRHLLEFGHRRIGYLGHSTNAFSRLREDGWREALTAAGLECRPDWMATDLVPGDMSRCLEAERVLSLPNRPTALFCGSDRIAARAMREAFSLGLRVPEDVSLIGYNGEPWSELLAVPLTTVAQPRLEIGERAARMLLDPPEGGAVSLILDPWLVARGSSGPVPG